MFSRATMPAQSDWFLWLLTTVPLAALPVLVNVEVWYVLRGTLPAFPLFRAEDLSYYSLVLISAFMFRIRKLDAALAALLLMMTVFCARPLWFSRHEEIMPKANSLFEPDLETAQAALVSAAVVTVLAALVCARRKPEEPRPPKLKLWGIRLLWAALPCLMNVYLHLSAVPCQILTINGLSFFSIALAAQGILDVTVSSRSRRMRAASLVPLILVAVLGSTVLGLWYFTELPLQQTASEIVVPALALTSRIVAALSLSTALVVEIELTHVAPAAIRARPA